MVYGRKRFEIVYLSCVSPTISKTTTIIIYLSVIIIIYVTLISLGGVLSVVDVEGRGVSEFCTIYKAKEAINKFDGIL